MWAPARCDAATVCNLPAALAVDATCWSPPLSISLTEFDSCHCLQVLGVSTSPDVTPQPTLLQGSADVYGLNITGGFGAGSTVEVVVSLQGRVAADQVCRKRREAGGRAIGPGGGMKNGGRASPVKV